MSIQGFSSFGIRLVLGLVSLFILVSVPSSARAEGTAGVNTIQGPSQHTEGPSTQGASNGVQAPSATAPSTDGTQVASDHAGGSGSSDQQKDADEERHDRMIDTWMRGF